MWQGVDTLEVSEVTPNHTRALNLSVSASKASGVLQ
jgi:hypothetical protein